MEVLYIPQLDEIDTSGDSSGSARYRIVTRVPSEGVVSLVDIDETVLSCQIGINIFSLKSGDGVGFLRARTDFVLGLVLSGG